VVYIINDIINERRKNMEGKKFNDIIVELRKTKGLTQQQLANKLNVTDKAVSKWERGLSYPDITSISSLAKVLDVDSSYLIDLCKKEDSINPYERRNSVKQVTDVIFRAIGVAMGVSVVVLNILGNLDIKSALSMLGIGLFCISVSVISNVNETDKKN
jgi:DNA-binding XRE family transcriptional regulator